jgi:hypothetical protein
MVAIVVMNCGDKTKWREAVKKGEKKMVVGSVDACEKCWR